MQDQFLINGAASTDFNMVVQYLTKILSSCFYFIQVFTIFLGTYYMFQCVYQVIGSSSILLVVPICRLKFLPEQISSKEPNPLHLSIYRVVHERKYRMLQISPSHTLRNLKSITPKLDILFWENLGLKESCCFFLKFY